MKTVPICVLAFRGGCPVTEAYLAYMHLNGLRPALILAVDHVGEGGKAARLRKLLGMRIAARLLRTWRNRAARIDHSLSQTLQKDWPVRLHPGQEPDFGRYCDNVIRLTVSDYADPRLLDVMRGCGVRTFLYCSGGRVPKSMFDHDFRILHIHPGVVPQIRGSDGLLWSMLVRGRPGASCFYMNAGIDTGDLLATREYDPPRWPEVKDSPEVLYPALLQCYDPHLRANLLVDVLNCLPEGEGAEHLPTVAQEGEWGHYFTMHPALRARVIARMCR